MPEAPDEYNPTVERWIKIYTTEDGFDLFDPLNPGDREPKEIGKDIQTFVGERLDKEKGEMETMQLQSGQNYNVSVSGKIRFLSSIFPEAFSGVYRNSVVLWFRNSSDPGTWFHPVLGNIQGTHFDKLDADGNFSFSFSFTGDLSGYDELIVLVNASNDAAFMPVPPDGYVSWHGNGYTAYYHESDGITASINPSQTSISITEENNNFPPDQGKVYRHVQQSKEYVEALYDGNLPFSLPAIYTKLHTENMEGKAGLFCSVDKCVDSDDNEFEAPFGPFIFINPVSGDNIKTISHEYGHKTNFRMWNSSTSKMANATFSLKEGWAEFFSFGVRNYTNRNFGDALLSNRTNAEEAPFDEDRYSGFSYLSRDRNVAAFGSYLWNLYDDPEDQTFLAAQYSQGDNDDINGHSLRVFEKMRTLGTTTISNYHNHFKSGLPSDEQSSVNKIYDFMFDDLYEIPEVQMRSSQVENFQKNINSGSIDFTWSSTSYPSHENYSNTETGYRLYRSAGSGWNLIQTLSEGTENYTYTTSNIYGDYRITAYNSSGNSANPPTISIQPPPLSVHITGPNNMFQGSTDTFTANVSSGSPPYTYQWYYRHENDCCWNSTGVSSQTYTHTAGPPNGEYVRVVVQDQSSQTEEDQHYFTILGWSMVAEDSSLPDEFSLTQNYPNPFNPFSTIRYELPERAEVTLSVYNMLGQRVALLVDGEVQPGRHEAVFEASNLSSGNYIARFSASGNSGEKFTQTLNMQLVK